MTSKRRIFKSICKPQKLWNKQGKWVCNDSKLLETISNIRSVSTECKETLAVKAKVKLCTKKFPSFFKRCITKRKEARKFFNLKGFQYHENKQKKLWQGAMAWFTVAWAAQQSVLSPTNRVVALKTCILATLRLVMSWQLGGWWHAHTHTHTHTQMWTWTWIQAQIWTQLWTLGHEHTHRCWCAETYTGINIIYVLDTDTDIQRYGHGYRHPDMEYRHRYGYLKAHKHR